MPAHLILGGRRSGKSAYAESLARASGRPLTYLATSRPYDRDHAARIAAHKIRRQGQGWTVLEVSDPLALQAQLDALATEDRVVLVDCLSMWLNNAFLDEIDVPDLRLPQNAARVVLVSLEVGLGLHPETALGRAYADALGLLNQALAAQADQVSLIIAGLPVTLKG